MSGIGLDEKRGDGARLAILLEDNTGEIGEACGAGGPVAGEPCGDDIAGVKACGRPPGAVGGSDGLHGSAIEDVVPAGGGDGLFDVAKSAGRRCRKECASTCTSRWCPFY